MRRRLHKISSYMKEVFKEFSADDILKYSASLAYYTVFSIAPLLVIISTLSGIFFGKEAVNGEVYNQLKELIGSAAAIQIQDIIKNIHLSRNNFFASTVSIIVLLIGATSIFGEVQDSLNKIWGLRVKKKKIWWKLILTRLLSFSLILSIGFIMSVSLILNALVSAFGNFLSRYIHHFSVYFIQTSESILSFIVASFLFSLMFKILPDAKIRWKDVLFGGFITAIFFTFGKLAIGYYLGKSNLTTLYGAAGSIIIIMVWVYYSSIILYLGAEFTKVHANLYGKKIQPNEYAEWIMVEQKHVLSPHLKNKDLS
ncbi:YihY/virulence factor BrkB family protein [Ginsengibacter hankyongi]|uniref:YihY/virulence factor BrkB family protein n=2 Tax=Ginsengibacter hankyongi TaxID=2607284 RepID=A0A5J5IRL5_9BACT|nr:YihY/virulence factor BrkB family protein [Ginsengibacter hankyongi]